MSVQLSFVGRSLVAIASALAVASVANAQPDTAGRGLATPTAGGPLIVERITNSFVAAPDFKITEIDDEAGALVGGYAGLLHDKRWLVGGAGYWLANGTSDRKLAYGGLLVGWTTDTSRRIAFGARSLAGAGQATLADDFLVRVGTRNQSRAGRGSVTTDTELRRFRFDETFFVFEPQGTVVIRIADALRMDWGVGYRLIGDANGAGDRLRGLTGSVAIRFGGK